MRIEVLKSTISDNLFFYVEGTEQCVLIDPIDAKTAIATVERTGKHLAWVLNTHWHPDHVGGNDEVLTRFPDAKLVSGPDAPMIHGEHPIDRVLSGGDRLIVDDLEFDVLEAPGHTDGHVMFQAGDDLFSGDVIFVAGAGHCRTGDPGQLFRTYRDVVAPLSDATRFYPGHDYAKRNLEFALSLQPDLTAATAFLDSLKGTPTLTTLAQERSYNPFFRSAESDLQDAMKSAHAALWAEQREKSEDDHEATFRTARALRNNW